MSGSHDGQYLVALRACARSRAVAQALGPAGQLHRPRSRIRAAGHRQPRQAGAGDCTLMARPPRSRVTHEPDAVSGTARIDLRTKRLVKRISPGEIMVIDHGDLDRVDPMGTRLKSSH